METIVDKLKAVADCNAEKAALVQGDKSLSYGALLLLAEKVAAVLQQEGLQKGDRVALVVENSPEYAALYYGTLLARGIVVSLNTASKEEDIKNWISHAGAELAFAKPVVVGSEQSSSSSVSLIRASSDYEVRCNLDDIENTKALYRPQKLDENDLASIIYTSGTTGEPKGVMLSHKNLASNMKSICDYLPIESDDRVLNVLPFYYSYGNSVLHTNLGIGATIILENSMMFPAKVVESMQNNKATAFYGVASTYAILLSRTKLSNYDLSAMRYVTQAGGPMPAAHIEQIMQILPQVQFFMMYGQTEATARLGYIPSELIKEKLGSAGKAIPGVKLEIRDEAGKVVPAGQEGEIYATGDNIMLGYWNNPEMTSQVVIDGWLRTGDIAKMDKDGYVYMTGRRTDMIKSGANRISPKEIEEKLAELDGVEESAAIGIPDEILGQAIKIFVVKRAGTELDKQSIMRHCKMHMAQYKIPKDIEFVQQLPKTGSGKIKRYLLGENHES